MLLMKATRLRLRRFTRLGIADTLAITDDTDTDIREGETFNVGIVFLGSGNRLCCR